jgi:hypothetical protein
MTCRMCGKESCPCDKDGACNCGPGCPCSKSEQAPATEPEPPQQQARESD